MDLIASSFEGLHCGAGGFYIDPWLPVEHAIITHGHADHARHGSAAYLCHPDTAPILRKRLGDVTIETLGYGERRKVGDVEISMHPAGHVLGSAQVRVKYRGEIWVASGDYKLENDGVNAPFEPVRCHTFITESTFALPIYRWRPQSEVFARVNAWWAENAEAGRTSIVYAYALGKAQRVLAHLDAGLGPILCHGAVEPINAIYRESGIRLPATLPASGKFEKTELSRALVLAPPSASGSPWLRRFGDYSDAFASGWMQVRGNRRRRGVDQGFALSDHADWNGLIAAIAATGASRVLATHGAAGALTRFLRERGVDAEALSTAYGEEDVETANGPEAAA